MTESGTYRNISIVLTPEMTEDEWTAVEQHTAFGEVSMKRIYILSVFLFVFCLTGCQKINSENVGVNQEQETIEDKITEAGGADSIEEKVTEVGNADKIEEANSRSTDIGKPDSQEDIGMDENDIDLIDDIDTIEEINEYMIPEQSFDITLNDWGEVRFVTCEPDPSKKEIPGDVTFYLIKEDEILYRFPYLSEGQVRSGYGLFWDVKFVTFMDTNDDGKEDIVIGPEYMTGAGPQGAVPHMKIRIYEDCGDSFTYNRELSDEINGYLPWESNVLAMDIKRLIQLINGNEPLTNYESYTGKWTVAPGYAAAYEEPVPNSGNELICRISNGNEFCGTLFMEQETTGQIVSVENIRGVIQNGELVFEFTDDGWGGTIHITFLPNQINVEVLNMQMSEENASGYGVSGNYEMTIRECSSNILFPDVPIR